MPWNTPTLRQVRGLVRDNIHASLPGSDATPPNSVLRVMSDAQGALCHLTLQYLDWLALQLLPDTAEAEWLDRHAQIWLVNSDGTTGRKSATLAQGNIDIAATISGVVIPQATQLKTSQDMLYETLDLVISSSLAPVTTRVRAIAPGSSSNMESGGSMMFIAPLDGVTSPATVSDSGITGGTDTETDDELRARVLKRIRQPPMGGSVTDYEAWALAVPGVTRAWAASEMGIGTVTVRFLMDDLRADKDGWPTGNDITTVEAYLDVMRPVAVKDFWVLAPIKQFIDVEIDNLSPDNPATREAIEQSLRSMLLEAASPGQTIFAAWKSFAVMSAPGVISFDLLNTLDDVMPSIGHMAVLGDIIYD